MEPEVYAELFQGKNEIPDAIIGGKSLFDRILHNYHSCTIILEMYNSKLNYSGILKKFYLESKAMELFLLQFSYLENSRKEVAIKLQDNDIEAIYHVRNLLENSMEHVSILRLALSVGIKQN